MTKAVSKSEILTGFPFVKMKKLNFKAF